MSLFSLSKFGENLPVTGVVAASQVAVGLGLGLLLSEKVGRSARGRAAIVLILLGVTALLPTVAGVTKRVINNPESERAMNRRLKGIRESGLPDDSETESY